MHGREREGAKGGNGGALVFVLSQQTEHTFPHPRPSHRLWLRDLRDRQGSVIAISTNPDTRQQQIP